ncbi:MAG: sodium-translocating pyrophosphatase [Ignavibacteria bacterium]|jgi:K(+)-stimulated pyrophosphate-energized sodium pump|nr:sodium-translocating pyrophosphatase [Ignavibacteria bacterium]MCU7504655.1 sodium-translocating pyrophosphatase [Ignavibacteria bacterium]MCU7517537.1 sodium-translocating pyrophosphatase [Ignavibacteria bacterium]
MEANLILAISILGLLFAAFLTRYVLKQDTGTARMQEISNAIKVGAEAFLRRQNRTIIYLAIALAAFIYIIYAFIRTPNPHDPASPSQLALWTTISFVLGAACSVAAGYMGMWVAIRSNIRTAAAAIKGMNGALQIALRGGAVSGFFVVAMSLLGVAGLFLIVSSAGVTDDPAKIPLLIVGYGFGASFVALFAQLGGGIYTKAADVGADLVGKVEAGIPEDDPRNPAVVADLVGDNVGDCAGRGADLFESTAAENIGAMILAAGLYRSNAAAFEAQGLTLLSVLLFPLVARAFGIIASSIGILVVKTNEEEDPMKALNRGFYVTAGIAMAGFFIASRWLLGSYYLNFFLCGAIGVLISLAFVYLTQYYTEYRYRPVKYIAEASQTGSATNIIAGLAVGMESTGFPVLIIGAGIVSTYFLGQTSGLKNAGLFGTAVATMGMLGTAAYILAMDTFGPITDNAGGIVEMSQQEESIRRKTDRLDSVGNTTKALTKGYAVGSAALAAFLLFGAYIDEVRNYVPNFQPVINLNKPEVFVGAILGAMLVYIFSSLAIKAVGKAAYSIIRNVRDQFKSNPGIMLGTSKPDYGQCVDIATKAALQKMVVPGLLVVGMTVGVGLVFKYIYYLGGGPENPSGASGAEVIGGYLMVATITGILFALFLNNGGGAWDNAKKYIETGAYGGRHTEPHKASVVGDTVGDPFKDTAGPSLHVLIKLLSTLTLVLAPLFI